VKRKVFVALSCCYFKFYIMKVSRYGINIGDVTIYVIRTHLYVIGLRTEMHFLSYNIFCFWLSVHIVFQITDQFELHVQFINNLNLKLLLKYKTSGSHYFTTAKNVKLLNKRPVYQ
jgi:hypothetical protein